MRSCFKAITYSEWLWTWAVVNSIESENNSVPVVALSGKNLWSKNIVLQINTCEISRNFLRSRLWRSRYICFIFFLAGYAQKNECREPAHLPPNFVVQCLVINEHLNFSSIHVKSYGFKNTNCLLPSMTLSALVVLLVEQCVSNVTREHDFKVLFKMSQIFFARASGAREGLFIQFRCGGRGDYPFVSTCSSIEVTILLISSQKSHFSV